MLISTQMWFRPVLGTCGMWSREEASWGKQEAEGELALWSKADCRGLCLGDDALLPARLYSFALFS